MKFRNLENKEIYINPNHIITIKQVDNEYEIIGAKQDILSFKNQVMDGFSLLTVGQYIKIFGRDATEELAKKHNVEVKESPVLEITTTEKNKTPGWLWALSVLVVGVFWLIPYVINPGYKTYQVYGSLSDIDRLYNPKGDK